MTGVVLQDSGWFVFLHQQRNAAQSVRKVLLERKELSVGYDILKFSEINRKIDQALEAVEQIEDSCKLVISCDARWFVVFGPTLLAAVDHFNEAVLCTLAAVRHQHRSEFLLYCNLAAINRQRGDIALLDMEARKGGDEEMKGLLLNADEMCSQASFPTTTLKKATVGDRVPVFFDDLLREMKKDVASIRCDVGLAEEHAKLLTAYALWWKKFATRQFVNNFMRSFRALQLEGASVLEQDNIIKSGEAQATANALENVLRSYEKTAAVGVHPNIAPVSQGATALYTQLIMRIAAHDASEITPGAHSDLIACAQLLTRVAGQLEEKMAWRDRVVSVQLSKTHLKELRLGMQAAIAAKCDAIATTVLESPLMTAQPGWGTHEGKGLADSFAALPLPGPENFYLAQHYADQHAAAVALQGEDEYHNRAAVYWEAASEMMEEYLSIVLGMSVGLTEGYTQEVAGVTLLRARCSAHYAASMCEDAIAFHGHAQQALRTSQYCVEGQQQQRQAAQDEAQAWESAAQKMLAAAEKNFLLSFVSVWNPSTDHNLQSFPAALVLERAALQEVHVAELLHHSAAALSSDVDSLSVTTLLERCCTRHQIAVARTATVSVATRRQHALCLGVLQKLLGALNDAVEGDDGTASADEDSGSKDALCLSVLQKLLGALNGAVEGDKETALADEDSGCKDVQSLPQQLLPDLAWRATVAVEYSGLVCRAAEATADRTALLTVFTTLSSLLSPTTAAVTDSDDAVHRLRALTLLAAADAHLQGQFQRSSLLLDSECFLHWRLHPRKHWDSDDLRGAYLHIAIKLVERALPREEIEGRFGPSLAAVYTQQSGTVATPALAALVKRIVDVAVARADAATLRRTPPPSTTVSSTAAATANTTTNTTTNTSTCITSRKSLYASADSSFQLAMARLCGLGNGEVEDGYNSDNNGEEGVVQAQLSAERYLLAAAALEQGQTEVSKYWRLAAQHGVWRLDNRKDWRSDVAEEVVTLSVKAVQALLDGSNSEVADAWCESVDLAVELMAEEDRESRRADFLDKMVTALAQLAQARADRCTAKVTEWEAALQHLEDEYAENETEEDEEDEEDEGEGICPHCGYDHASEYGHGSYVGFGFGFGSLLSGLMGYNHYGLGSDDAGEGEDDMEEEG